MSDKRIAIVGGKLVVPCETREGNVLIERDKIKGIVDTNAPLPEDVNIIDASGCLVLPGLVDLHVQGGGGSDLLSEEPECVCKVCRSLAGFGTTTFLATTVVDTTRDQQPHLERIVSAREKGEHGAEIAGIHLEGPFINPEKQGMIRDVYIDDCDGERWRDVQATCGNHLKMMTVAPELPGIVEVIKDMTAKGITAALGHTNATLSEARTGIKAGISHVTHVANAMRSLHHREPGALGAVLMDDGLTMQIITDGRHLHPDFVRWLIALKSPQNTCIITDGMGAMEMPPGRYCYGGLEYTIEDGTAYYDDGTLIGTALTQLQLLGRAWKFAGLPLHEVVNMASLYPARVIGMEDRKGSIEESKDADLIVCDHSLNIRNVILKGRVVDDKSF